MSFDLINPDAALPLVITAEHAGNAWPAELPPPDFPAGWQESHIAYDPGTALLAKALAERLDCVALMGKYTRLLVDLNRMEDAPDIIASASDGIALEGNLRLSPEEKQRRIAVYYRPYHDRLKVLLDERGKRGIMLSLHSFTSRLATDPRSRPWQVGVLYHEPNRLTELLLKKLRRQDGLCVGDNEPYDLREVAPGAVFIHARPRSIPYAEIEIRAPLLLSGGGVRDWCERLAGIMEGIEGK